MTATVVDVLKIVAPLSVALIVFSQGLAISLGQVVDYFRTRPAMMIRSLLTSLVLVPAVALVLILILAPSPALAIVLAILVACPPAPLMISSAPKQGHASAPFMASLHLSLAVLAFGTVPAVLYLLSIPLGFSAAVDLAAMGWILARTILLPIGVGLAVRALSSSFSDRIGPMLGRAGSVGLFAVMLLALVVVSPALLKLDAWSYVVIASVSAAALATGHLLGPTDPNERTTLAIECGVRHPALALTIAAATLGAEKALPMIVPCAVTFIGMATLYLAWRRRRLAV